MKTFKSIISEMIFSYFILRLLDECDIYSWPVAIRAYSAAVSIKERHDVAKAALNVIAFIANLDASIRKKLVEVPDLFASIATLCDEELFQQEDSQEIINNINEITKVFMFDGIRQTTLLIEANWAGLLLRSFQYTNNRYNAIMQCIGFVFDILKFKNGF